MGFLDESGLTSYDNNMKTYVDKKLEKKVNVVYGKGLSTEDYTTEEKNKLSGLNSTLLNKLSESEGGNLTFDGNEINTAQMIGATSTANGVPGLVPAPMSGQEEYVLKGNGNWGVASVNTDSCLSFSSENPIQNKAVAAAINGFEAKTITRNSDGSIDEIDSAGNKKHTAREADGSITTTLYDADDVQIAQKTTRINGDGSISVEVV